MSSEEKKESLIIRTRYFERWLAEQHACIAFTAYKSGVVYVAGLTEQKTISLWTAQMPRPMGIAWHKNKLWCASMGNLIEHHDAGPMDVQKYEATFDVNFMPKHIYLGGDVDIHDVVVDPKDDMPLYCSALFSVLAKLNPTTNATFSTYFQPPWISKLAAEDRCHLNGVCVVDGVPRYVTAAGMRDTSMSWRDNKNEGVVYDLVEKRVVCSGLSFPHSPRWYKGKLYVLESGSGSLGYVDLVTGKFVKQTFIPGFLRGLQMHGNYAVVLSSKDRHEHNFVGLELGKILEERGIKIRCGLWIVNMTTMDCEHSLHFDGDGVSELYDVAIIPNCTRARVIDHRSDEFIRHFVVGEKPLVPKEDPTVSGDDKPLGTFKF